MSPVTVVKTIETRNWPLTRQSPQRRRSRLAHQPKRQTTALLDRLACNTKCIQRYNPTLTNHATTSSIKQTAYNNNTIKTVTAHMLLKYCRAAPVSALATFRLNLICSVVKLICHFVPLSCTGIRRLYFSSVPCHIKASLHWQQTQNVHFNKMRFCFNQLLIAIYIQQNKHNRKEDTNFYITFICCVIIVPGTYPNEFRLLKLQLNFRRTAAAVQLRHRFL